MAQIRDALIEFNSWWLGEGTSPEFKERGIYGSIKKFMPRRQIIALVGIRRVGKTTLLMKVVEDAIKSGMEPERIIYFSFDEFRNVEIRSIIREYEGLKGKNIRHGKYLLLLDEVQKVEGWQDQLKSIYDSYREIKILVSGSESLFIRKLTKETLSGRILELKVETLSFMEFLAFKGIDHKKAERDGRGLVPLLREFIASYGFPELVGIGDQEFIGKYIREGIIDKVLYKDIPELFEIRDIGVLASIQKLVMDEPGQIVELSGLSKELGISRQSLSGYLLYLEDSFLIRKLYNYSRNARKVERSLRKYYPVLVSPSLMANGSSEVFSKVFEWFIVNQLHAEFFWRDPQKHEVDIVLKGDGPIPVEIKYGKLEADGLLAFMARFKIKKGYIISYDKEEAIERDGMKVIVIPAAKALLRPELLAG